MRVEYKAGSDQFNLSRKGKLCGSWVGDFLGIGDKSRAIILKKMAGTYEDVRDHFRDRLCGWGVKQEPNAVIDADAIFPNGVFKVGSLASALPEPLSKLEGSPDIVTIDCNGNYIPIEIKTRCMPDFDTAVPYCSKEVVPSKHWCQLQTYELLLAAPYGYLLSYTSHHGYKLFCQLFCQDMFDKCVAPLLKEYDRGILPTRTQHAQKQFTQNLIDYHVRDCTSEVFSLSR